jgi:hypothetical protein
MFILDKLSNCQDFKSQKLIISVSLRAFLRFNVHGKGVTNPTLLEQGVYNHQLYSLLGNVFENAVL